MGVSSRATDLVQAHILLLSPTAEATTLTFTQNTSKDAVPSKDVPFEVFENKKIIIRPQFSQKIAIFVGTFRPKTA